MKLSKSLLQAMMISITVVGTTSCVDSLLEEVKDSDLKPNKERAILMPHDLLDNGNEKDDYPYDCPGCGMG